MLEQHEEMKTVPTSKVKIGDEIVEPVRNIQGIVLFKAGELVTEKHLKALKGWGVTEISVKDDGIETADSKPENFEIADEKLHRETEKELDHLFQKTDKEDPVITKLYNLVLQKKITSIKTNID